MEEKEKELFDCPEGQKELEGRKGIVMKISYNEKGKCTRANGCVINCKLKRPQRG
ncbi:MAG: hypothetical protein NT136_03555 [Candidatus Moranbacteria bacterium]|nr:hypothetical protein [Candidatus Moranbacteria bacterium]